MFALHDPLPDALRTELSAYDDLTAALLARRGITRKQDAEMFLNPSYDQHLHDPLRMTDMQKAAARLAHAILTNESIVVWSDFDCDGVPAGVLLHDFLKKCGATFTNYIPHRHDEGYGVNTHGIDKLHAQGVSLVVTADVGITDNEAVAHAKELGVDVIVTDHHLPGDTLPDAYAVVNPNARVDEPYPFKSLCGSGVAWKLVCATLSVSPEIRNRVPIGWEKWLLDMVGLATIADMVPLVEENRVLATYGLLVLRKSPRLGLKKLCETMRINQRSLTEDDIGFMLAPRINAASRMGDAMDAFTLFTTDDVHEAERLAKKLESANRKRKAAAGAITRAVRARLQARGALREVIALGDPEWRPSLLGLVANNLADEYERPVFLWGREGTMSMKGSCRSGGTINVVELMQAAAPNTFAEFGGHAASGGFTLSEESVFHLEDLLVDAFKTISKRETFPDTPGASADLKLTPEEVHTRFLAKLERLSPFGVSNPKPTFLFESIVVHHISYFGKGNEHLKLSIASDEGIRAEGVAFFVKGTLSKKVATLSPGSRAHVLAHLERDMFSRDNSVRLRLIDIQTQKVHYP